jgi:hypothetical protein
MANSAAQKKQMSGNNLVIIMVLISLIVIGVTALSVKFLITSIILDSHVLKAKLSADATVKQDVTNAPQLINSYNALGTGTQTLNDALPTSVDFPSLVIEMENMAGTAGVSLLGVTTSENTVTASPASSSSSGSAVSTGPSASAGTPGTTAATSLSGGSSTVAPPQPFTFTVSYTGSFDATTRFVAALESSVRPMEVTGVTLNGSGSALNATLNVTTWYSAPAQLPFGTESVK